MSRNVATPSSAAKISVKSCIYDFLCTFHNVYVYTLKILTKIFAKFCINLFIKTMRVFVKNKNVYLLDN